MMIRVMWGNRTQRVSVRSEHRANDAVDNCSRPVVFSSHLTAKREYRVTGFLLKARDTYATILFLRGFLI